MSLILAIVLVAIAAGCGESDSSADSGQTGKRESAQTGKREVAVQLKTVPITKAQYVAHIDRICDESWAFMLGGFESRYPRVARDYRNEQDDRAEGKRFQGASRNIFLAGLQAQFDDIQYIGAPSGEERQIAIMLHAMQRAVYNGWERHITSARELSNIFGRFTVLAYHYGVNRCLVYESNFREEASKREEA